MTSYKNTVQLPPDSTGKLLYHYLDSDGNHQGVKLVELPTFVLLATLVTAAGTINSFGIASTSTANDLLLLRLSVCSSSSSSATGMVRGIELRRVTTISGGASAGTPLPCRYGTAWDVNIRTYVGALTTGYVGVLGKFSTWEQSPTTLAAAQNLSMQRAVDFIPGKTHSQPIIISNGNGIQLLDYVNFSVAGSMDITIEMALLPVA